MIFYSSSFQDIDLLRDSVVKWNLEVFPLEVGSLDYRIKQAVTPNFLIGEGDFSCRTEQRGVTPKGFRTFVIPANDFVQYCWRGRCITGNCLSLFPENGELHSISNHTFHVYTVSFQESIFDEARNTIESKRLDHSVRGENVWLVEYQAMNSMRQLARSILCQSALKKPIEHLKQMLLGEILRAVRDSEENHPRMNQLKKHAVLKRATDWMRERTREPAPLSELYQELSISERSAQIAFKDQFGLSLKTYYRNYRMTRVREALRNANRTRTVGEVAASFGYWHLGQFSKDYKNVIGELPSKTLYSV